MEIILLEDHETQFYSKLLGLILVCIDARFGLFESTKK